MPKFTILSRVDAFVDYVAEVEAQTAAEAAQLAYYSTEINWKEAGISQFDARHVVAIDKSGREIAGTEFGDFT